MGKTILVAVIAAVLASLATNLVMASFPTEQAAHEREQIAKDRQVLQVIERRIGDMERKAAASRERVARARSDEGVEAEVGAESDDTTASGAAAGPSAVAPDGSPYVSRAEVEKLFAERAAATAAAGQAPATPPVPKRSLEEIAGEMNLSAGEEANLRIILRESEEEMLHSLFGVRPVDDIIADVEAAKQDPEKDAELKQQMIVRGIGNVGKLLTLEKRMKKKVESVLGPERAAEFLAKPRKPVISDKLEEVFKGF